MGKTCGMEPGRDKNMFTLHNLVWSRIGLLVFAINLIIFLVLLSSGSR